MIYRSLNSNIAQLYFKHTFERKFKVTAVLKHGESCESWLLLESGE